MAITPNMNLDLPTPTVTLGPEYAVQNNDAFEVIDSHNHASGNGVRIPVAGLNINGALNFNGQKPYSLLSAQFNSQVAALSGASNANSVYSVNGDLYWTNGSGTAVQLTSGAAPITVPGAVQQLEFDAINSSISINAGDAYVFINLDTTGSRTITLPLASAVAEGRFYIIKDATGTANTNPFTLAASGSDLIDGAASQVYGSNYGSVSVISNGVDKWSVW
jgi:hypothetical protein